MRKITEAKPHWVNLVTKPLAQRRCSFYKEYDELGQILSPVIICMHNQFALRVCLDRTYFAEIEN